MEVRWFRDRFDRPVHLYLKKKDQPGTQDSDYRGRTALPPSALQTGDLSLHLRNLQPSDRGIYTCLADDGSQYEEGQTEVIVAGDFFPGVSGWMVSLFLTLTLSIGAIPLLVIQRRRMNRMLKMYEVKAVLHLQEELEWKWILSSAVGMHIPVYTRGWASDCQCFTRLFYSALRIHLIPVKQFVSLNHN
ncbi:UNVERIFIED_CONTAM: hypothetical protein FKN15_004369 [Acipenser sinensis]